MPLALEAQNLNHEAPREVAHCILSWSHLWNLVSQSRIFEGKQNNFSYCQAIDSLFSIASYYYGSYLVIFLILPPVNFADIGVFDISIIRRENIKMKEQNNSVAMCCLFLDLFLSDLLSNLIFVISLKPYQHKSLGEILETD